MQVITNEEIVETQVKIKKNKNEIELHLIQIMGKQLNVIKNSPSLEYVCGCMYVCVMSLSFL